MSRVKFEATKIKKYNKKLLDQLNEELKRENGPVKKVSIDMFGNFNIMYYDWNYIDPCFVKKLSDIIKNGDVYIIGNNENEKVYGYCISNGRVYNLVTMKSEDDDISDDLCHQ